jgi:nucleoside-diphosphate-sugar epimerase
MSNADKVVAVTGASGYIAGHIIKILLSKGYTVKAVVRDLSKPEKFEFLKKMPQKDGQIQFVAADIQEMGAYNKIFVGCHAVIHTATPYIHSASDPQKEIVDPAVNGTLHAMNAAIEAKVKRIVVTSSGGAMFHFPVEPGYTFSEKDWNSGSSLATNAYFHSKRLAEEAAWTTYKASDPHKVELAVVNPLFVVGPTQSPILNTSLNILKRFLTGEQQQPMTGFVGWVDVRDVAAAHVIAMEHPDADGKRLICCAEVRSWKDMSETLAKQFPEFPVFKDNSEVPSTAPYSIDTSALQKLGWKANHNFEEMLKDAADSLISTGAVAKK